MIPNGRMAAAIHRSFNLDSHRAGDGSRLGASISMLEDAAGAASV